jgi:serine protease
MNRTANIMVLSLAMFFPVLAQPAEKDMAALASQLDFPATQLSPKKAVTVAVVDDAFLLSHKSINDYIYTNPGEIPGNYVDDDGNGFIDDVHGWDISDADADVSVAKEKRATFYHGTYIAGIITSIFQRLAGTNSSFLRIIPVKTTADNARMTYLTDGYKGLRYAISLNPDIICCAWSGGNVTDEDKALIKQAAKKGIIIVSSAGNFFCEKIDEPGSMPEVLTVAAVDSANRKFSTSNFGMPVDLSVPGKHIYGPYSTADNAFSYFDGTSPSSAITVGCIAALKAAFPDASQADLLSALKCTATPIDSLNPSFSGKLGAGVPDLTKAVEFLQNPDFRYSCFNPKLPEGTVYFSKKTKTLSWNIAPDGDYHGLHLSANSTDYKGKIRVFADDSLRFDGDIAALRKDLFTAGNRFRLELPKKSLPSKGTSFSYSMETIDSTTLYCKGIQYLTGEYGTISDNSGNENYANNCTAQWQITVPEGKHVLIEFDELDTQPNVDFVWIFEGDSTLPENILAKFSGHNPPPHVLSRTNKVLIWFVTDGAVTSKGWKLRYTAVSNN